MPFFNEFKFERICTETSDVLVDQQGKDENKKIITSEKNENSKANEETTELDNFTNLNNANVNIYLKNHENFTKNFKYDLCGEA